jgi:hypothetical protein
VNRRFDISIILASCVALIGLLLPNVAAAMGACIEPSLPKNEVVEAFEYLENARTEEAALMSVKVDPSAQDPAEPDCSTLDDDSESDPKFAACYDSVDLPVSTIPSLFAQHQADTASAGILGRVGDLLGKAMESAAIEPNPNEASVELTPAQRMRQAWKDAAQSVPRHEAMCTTQSPDNCRAAPALPSLWIPEVSSPSAANELFEFDVDPTEDSLSKVAALNRADVLTSVALDVPVPPPR